MVEEQAHSYDEKSDSESLTNGCCSNLCEVWSFGMVLYEMITLQIPYHEVDIFSVKKVILSKKIPSVPEVPTLKLFTDLIRRCVCIDPSERPSAAQALQIINGP